jgi:CheY-like chemotaxis protein
MAAETILIVDDDPICLTIASFALRTAGFTVKTAFDGMEALDLLQTLQPDLILSDIQMPNIDGFELARRTRQIARLRDVPMIALTAFDAPDTEERAFAAGFTAYMKKPLQPGMLAARIRRFLDRRIAPCT